MEVAGGVGDGGAAVGGGDIAPGLTPRLSQLCEAISSARGELDLGSCRGQYPAWGAGEIQAQTSGKRVRLHPAHSLQVPLRAGKFRR